MSDFPLTSERRLVICTDTGDIKYQNFDASFDLRYIQMALACAGWTIVASARNVKVRNV